MGLLCDFQVDSGRCAVTRRDYVHVSCLQVGERVEGEGIHNCMCTMCCSMTRDTSGQRQETVQFSRPHLYGRSAASNL